MILESDSRKEAQLLRDWLSPQQLADLTSTGSIRVKGSAGGRYELGIGYFTKIRMDWFGKGWPCHYCVRLHSGTSIDQLVGLKVMLENDEVGVRRSANKW